MEEKEEWENYLIKVLWDIFANTALTPHHLFGIKASVINYFRGFYSSVNNKLIIENKIPCSEEKLFPKRNQNILLPIFTFHPLHQLTIVYLHHIRLANNCMCLCDGNILKGAHFIHSNCNKCSPKKCVFSMQHYLYPLLNRKPVILFFFRYPEQFI